MLGSPTRFIAPLLALTVTVGTLSAVAQTKKSTSRSKATSAEKEAARYHRLPAYFGKLELDDDQKDDIYSIKEEYGPKINELQEQLDELKQEMNAEIEDVLTSSQKTELAKLKGRSSSSKTKPVSSSRTKKSSKSKESDEE